jgi:hypothetical protein
MNWHGGTTCWSPDGKQIATVVYEWKRLDDGFSEHANSRIEIADTSSEGHRALRLPRWEFDLADWC